jgi:hypothetical protein
MKKKFNAALILIALAIVLVLSPVRFYRWDRPANMEPTPHMFQAADHAACLWWAQHIVKCWAW